MINQTAVSTTFSTSKADHLPTGRLLINDADEIIYANKQARHFLGLLAEESIQAEQKLMPLLRQTYQFFPTNAWTNWPKRPSTTTSRYLIYKSPHSIRHTLLKVDIVEQILLGGKNIWVVAIQLVESERMAANHLVV